MEANDGGRLLRRSVEECQVTQIAEYLDRAGGRKVEIGRVVEQLLFGTDYPYPRDASSIAGLRQLRNTAELENRERRGFLGGAAARLIPRGTRVESTV